MSVEELVVQHVSWISMKARRYYTNRDDADDLASETIYKCLSNAKRYNDRMSFNPWVLSIMANTYITQYNRRRCVLFTGLDEYDPMSETERADQRASVGSIMAVIDDCSHRSRCIDAVMLYAKGYTQEEIADKLKIPVGTVKSRISLGRKMLREALEEPKCQ